MKLKKKHFVGVGFALILVAASIFLFRGTVLLYFMVALSLVFGLLPFMFSLLLEQGAQREKEEKFLAFSRDLVENVKSGTPIAKSIINLQNREYGALSMHVKKLANQISMGITLENALINFARDTKSVSIKRAVALISEAQKAGGQIETILESVAKSINQTEDLKKERRAAVSNLITQGYMIFFVFIIIMLVLEFKILPLVSDLSSAEGVALSVKQLDSDSFSMPLFVMLMVQSFFAGLVIGKISEGTLKSGIKHSFILITVTLLVTTGARALFGG